jgi:hypothetical protein
MIAAIKRLPIAAAPLAKILIDPRIANGLDENSEILLNMLMDFVLVGLCYPSSAAACIGKASKAFRSEGFFIQISLRCC